ncbi:MAG: metallophosphoesterase [Balneolaceae bacterium]
MVRILLFFTCFLLVCDVQAQEIPVTNRPPKNAETTFRFAIVSDRTGGMRADIFDGAIDKVEMMQPEFVLSVGDLIDGYTEDPKVWNAQWDEFDTIVEKLSMPFYYVPGNHDTSNKLLTEVWRERHGRDFYHFVYNDVLFLAINTDEIEGGGIGNPQIEYFQKVLEENKEVRWTLLFMHRPLWSYGNRLGYDGIEKALGERNYTLFSGHHHHYRYKMHNGMEHFTLATTGGGSWMRNPDVGELDHITWVTMKDNGPEIANIDINGIYSKNLVDEKDYADIQVLRQGNWLNMQPVVHSSNRFDELPIKLKVENNSQRTFKISGTLPDQYGIEFKPSNLEFELEKGGKTTIDILAKSVEGESLISQLNNSPLQFELTAGFEREGKTDISLSTTKRLFLDWNHSLIVSETPILIDGNLIDWEQAEWINVLNPQYFREGWDWKGSEDGRFEFATTFDDENIYLAVKFFDQITISDSLKLSSRQDKFYIHLDSNSKTEKHTSYEIAFSGVSTIPLSSSDEIEAAIVKNKELQILEVRVPFSEIEFIENLERIRINIGVMDHDRPENTKPSVLWWRPVWNTADNYENSGVFYLKN